MAAVVALLFVGMIALVVIGAITVMVMLVDPRNRRFKPTITSKGRLGEDVVTQDLTALNESLYCVLHDVMIPTSDGRTSQIDHIVVARHGKIFVIETKNLSGWITGGETDRYWRQTIYKRRSQFMNPLHQNFGHVEALKEILTDTTDFDYIPMVAFTRKANLKITVGTGCRVVYADDVARTIQEEIHVKVPIERVKEVANKIASQNVVDLKKRQQHGERVQAKKRLIGQKIAADICPHCGGQLVQRHGKYGQFGGCRNYPKCRFTVE